MASVLSWCPSGVSTTLFSQVVRAESLLLVEFGVLILLLLIPLLLVI